MPFIFSDAANMTKSIQKNIPVETFLAWKEIQKLRNNAVGSRDEVDLTEDPEKVLFHVKTIEEILLNKPVHIVMKFGCNLENGKYRNLYVAIQGRNDERNKILTKIYTGHIKQSSDDVISEIDWEKMENNFALRNRIITEKEYSSLFAQEQPGISHTREEFEEWFDFSKNQGMQELALFFVRDTEKTTVAYMDAAKIPTGSFLKMDSNTQVQDQGNGCCPK